MYANLRRAGDRVIRICVPLPCIPVESTVKDRETVRQARVRLGWCYARWVRRS